MLTKVFATNSAFQIPISLQQNLSKPLDISVHVTILLDQMFTQLLFKNSKLNAYSTEYSQAVTHPSTNSAQRCLTAVIRRELVFST